MTLILDIQNQNLYKKIKWLLSHFTNEGLNIIENNYVDDKEMKEILNDKDLYNSLKNGLKEIENKEYEFV